MILIALVFIVELCLFTVPSISKILGFNDPYEINDIHSAYFKEGNIVSVKFDCVLKGNVSRAELTRIEGFFVLKFGNEQFVYVRVPSREKSFWYGVDFFEYAADAVGYKAEKPFTFTGVVKKTDETLRQELLSKTEHMWLDSLKMINNEENSNLDYYIELIYPGNEKMYLAIELVVHIVLIALFVWTYKRYKHALWEEAVEEEKIQTI